MTANGLYNVEYNTQILKTKILQETQFQVVTHETVLKIDSLTAAAFISLQHVLLLVQRVQLVCHNTILQYVEGIS
jgi:hypothetical protein